ncbi:hypothetical protein [Nocardiopsis quinghaiensis]|uniref:hypothetical protein n=1 Tax=Nocardiopsis quinghaiensis TaxID=464995 RepID=UPI001CC24151|nr:hypothetical protein [Nocardiopsis quinghaiensis]
MLPNAWDHASAAALAAAYEEAGADGVFVPGLCDEEELAALAGALAERFAVPRGRPTAG